MNLRPILLALLLPSSALAAPYTDAKYGFTVTPPPGWQQTNFQGTEVVYVNPVSASGFRPNINVVVQAVPVGTTLARFHQGTVEQIRSYLPGGRVIQTRAVRLGGQAANEVVYTGRNEPYSLYFIALYTVKGARAYIVTGTTVLGKQGDMAQRTRAFAASLTFSR